MGGYPAVMQTLHIVGSRRPGGAENFFIRLVNALQESGWQPQALLRHGSALAGRLDPAVQQRQTAMYSSWDGWSRWQVGRAIRQLRPQLVQTYMGRATGLTRLPTNHPVHVARLGGYYKLKDYRHAHAWIANTRGLCDYLLEHGLPAGRVFHIYNFIDFPEQQSAAVPLSVPLSGHDWMLLAAGRLVPVKGIEYLLTAFARLPAVIAGRTLQLVILGDGPLGTQLQQQAQQSGIAGRVHWGGWQADVAPYYQRADLVVFPSLLQEALGNVILETWACRKPLLTSASRGALELCRHGTDAWQVACGDAAALAQGIRTLLEDDELRNTLAAAGHQHARKVFSKAVILEQYQTLYRQLTGC
jgi:glycosyltransferase involved in cell wall biosynthesis